MGVELPFLSAVVARLPHAEIQLAAYGGIVFPLALIIESPIIMLLAASTALSRDLASYVKLRRFMHSAGFFLTLVHAAVAFTPLYDFVARSILGVPADIIEPGRLGLRIMTPWTWSIAYRRFHQGVLIRFGRSRAVGLGSLVRLSANAAVLTAGYLLHDVPGIIVAAATVTAGVVSEAVYVGIRVRPVLKGPLLAAAAEDVLTRQAFTRFYLPLAVTSLLDLLMQPIGAAALSRMPRALDSLAAWPALAGLVFMSESFGIAFNEVMVALLGEPGSLRPLRRFAVGLMLVTTGVLALVVATPLAPFWFGRIGGLAPTLASLARMGLWFALPMPALAALCSYFQGAILHGRETRAIPESLAVFLGTAGILCVVGVWWGGAPGIYVGTAALTTGSATRALWLWARSRSLRRALAVG